LILLINDLTVQVSDTTGAEKKSKVGYKKISLKNIIVYIRGAVNKKGPSVETD